MPTSTEMLIKLSKTLALTVAVIFLWSADTVLLADQGSAYAQGSGDKETKTRKTPSMGAKVYERLAEAQVAAEAKDYVEAMWMILQQDKPDDYVCSTGVSHSVKDLVEYVFGKLGLEWTEYVKQDPAFLRSEELNNLKGDHTKLTNSTGWVPTQTFETM